MFLASFPAGPWQANCYLAAPAERGDCFVVDPGMQAMDGVHRLCGQYGLTPKGIVLSHGHIDHIGSATALAEEYGVPCWLHEADRRLLTDPGAGLDPASAAMLSQLLGGITLTEPPDLRFYDQGDQLDLAGLGVSVIHAPGHTEGCVMMQLDYPGHPSIASVIFTGDVLFAGSIGRTDLPGGDPSVMAESLRTRVLGLPDNAALLPGHGQQSTMALERTTNPFLQADFLRT